MKIGVVTGAVVIALLVIGYGWSTVTNSKAGRPAETSSLKSSSSKSGAVKSSQNLTVQKDESSASRGSASHSSKAPAKAWNPNKRAQLATFMQQWGQTMGQKYDQYEPGNDTDFYGERYPDALKKQKVAVNEQPVSVEWSTDGAGTKDYQVVATYSDCRTARYLEKHLYLFTLHHGQPVVLITMQNQWAPGGRLYFKATTNQELAQGFEQIVNGKGTPSSATSKANESGTAPAKTDGPQPYSFPKQWQRTWYTTSDDGMLQQKNQVFIKGWYQQNGAGKRYAVHHERVGDQQVDVLLSGSNVTNQGNVYYYPTQALADQAKTQSYADFEQG